MTFVLEDAYKNLLGVGLALLLILVAYFQWKFSYWRRKGVSHPSPSIPFGNTALFGKKSSLMQLLMDSYRDYKSKGLKYCGLYFLVEPIVVLIDLDLIKTILVKDFQHFTDHGDFTNEKREPLTGHLFNLNGSRWKSLRAQLTPSFSSAKIKMMFQNFVDCTRGLLEVVDQSVESGEALDIKETVGRFTTDVIGSCAFGLECNSLKNPDSEFRKHGMKMFRLNKLQAFVRHLALISPKLLHILGFRTMDKEISEFFINMVQKTVDYREKNNVTRKDLMHFLIQLKNNVSIEDEQYTSKVAKKLTNETNALPTLTIEEMAAHAFVFFIGGLETSSKTLTFCLYELAANINIQERLRKEIIGVLEGHDGEVTFDALVEMHYMDKCIQETLRKYPPLTALVRKCTKDYRFPNCDLVLEEGTRVFISITAIHHDPEYYPDSEKFDPERFSSENKAKRHPFSWIPFGEGPRACIGKDKHSFTTVY